MGVSTDTAATTPLAERSPQELQAYLEAQRAAYDALCERGLTLDLTRGKPSSAQLDLSDRLLSLPEGVTRTPTGSTCATTGA
jgi:hypothetical protein